MQDCRQRAQTFGGWLVAGALIAFWWAAPVGSAPGSLAKKTTSVRVVNTAEEAATVREVGPVEPVQISATTSLDNGESTDSATFTYVVPQGKRLVVTTISGFVTVQPGQAPLLTLYPTSGGLTQLAVPVELVGTFTGLPRYVFGGPYRLHVPPGTSPEVALSRSPATGDATASVTLIGYLTPAPTVLQ